MGSYTAIAYSYRLLDLQVSDVRRVIAKDRSKVAKGKFANELKSINNESVDMKITLRIQRLIVINASNLER